MRRVVRLGSSRSPSPRGQAFAQAVTGPLELPFWLAAAPYLALACLSGLLCASSCASTLQCCCAPAAADGLGSPPRAFAAKPVRRSARSALDLV